MVRPDWPWPPPAPLLLSKNQLNQNPGFAKNRTESARMCKNPNWMEPNTTQRLQNSQWTQTNFYKYLQPEQNRTLLSNNPNWTQIQNFGVLSHLWHTAMKVKVVPYSRRGDRIPKLIPVPGNQHTGDRNNEPVGPSLPFSHNFLNSHFSRWTWGSRYSVSILQFSGVKDDGSVGDNRSYKTCKAPVKLPPTTNQHQVSVFYMKTVVPLWRLTW